MVNTRVKAFILAIDARNGFIFKIVSLSAVGVTNGSLSLYNEYATNTDHFSVPDFYRGRLPEGYRERESGRQGNP